MLKAFFTRLFQEISKVSPPSPDLLPVTNSNRELCLELLGHLKENLHKPYVPMAASAIFISVPVLNINQMLALMRKYNQALKQNKAINPDDCNWSAKVITLDQFFIGDDDCYISSSTIVELVQESQRLCDFMQGSEEAEYGVPEHNKRMLSKFFEKLKNILAALLSILSD